MKNKSLMMGYLSAVLAVSIWGTVYNIKLFLLPVLNSMQIVFIQYLISLPILVIMAAMQGKSFKINKDCLPVLILSGGIGLAAFQMSVNFGVKYCGSVVAAIFAGLVPSMCLLVDFFVLRKAMNKFKIASIILSTAGIFLVVGKAAGQSLSVIGCIILLISDIAWIVLCYFNQKLQLKHNISSTILMAYQSLFTCLIALAFVFRDFPVMLSIFSDTKLSLSMLYVAVINVVAAYSLFNFALKKVSVIYCNVIDNFTPVVTIIVDYILYKTQFAALQLAGTVLVILSAALPYMDKSAQADEK